MPLGPGKELHCQDTVESHTLAATIVDALPVVGIPLDAQDAEVVQDTEVVQDVVAVVDTIVAAEVVAGITPEDAEDVVGIGVVVGTEAVVGITGVDVEVNVGVLRDVHRQRPLREARMPDPQGCQVE